MIVVLILEVILFKIQPLLDKRGREQAPISYIFSILASNTTAPR